MKVYNIKKGTNGKLITQIPEENIQVVDWVTTKDLTFTHPALDRVSYANADPKPPSDCLAVRLVKEGYMLFSTSNTPKSKYILAIKEADVELLI